MRGGRETDHPEVWLILKQMTGDANEEGPGGFMGALSETGAGRDGTGGDGYPSSGRGKYEWAGMELVREGQGGGILPSYKRPQEYNRMQLVLEGKHVVLGR